MSDERQSSSSTFIRASERAIVVLERALLELDTLGESPSVPPLLLEEIASAAITIGVNPDSQNFPMLELCPLMGQFQVMIDDLISGKIDLVPSVMDALRNAVPLFRQIVVAEKEGSDRATIDINGLLSQITSALSTARAAASETAWERALLSRLDDNEMLQLQTNIARGDKLSLIQVNLDPTDVGRRLFELRKAIKMHGALITYRHTGTDKATKAMSLDILMTLTAEDEPLHATLATLGMTIRPVPALTKLLATRPPRTPKDDGSGTTETRAPAKRDVRTYHKMPYRFYVRSQLAAMRSSRQKIDQIVKQHGEIVASSVSRTRDPEIVDIKVFMKSNASGSELKAAFADLGATAEQQPQPPAPVVKSVEPAVAEAPELPETTWLYHYKIPAWNLPIEEADRVELLCLPECDIISDANWPEEFFEFVAERHMLTGTEAQQVIQDFSNLAPAEPARCHTPPWGLAFYAGDTLLFTVTLCYECWNAYVYAGQEKMLRAFATFSPAGQSLAAILNKYFPCSKWDE